MSLITSISGLRGTIGGESGQNLTPVDVVRFTAAYVSWLKENRPAPWSVVLGRDARPSGLALQNLVASTLQFSGCNIIDLDLATTPTVAMAVLNHQADGGIVLSASHNPREWNALKLLNHEGEFLSAEDGQRVLTSAQESHFHFVPVAEMGELSKDENALDYHIDQILKLRLVDLEAIRQADFKIAVDGVNSVGSVAIPRLLEKLGVNNIYLVNEEMNGHFAHNPEPLPGHLNDLESLVKTKKADLGIAVDPDVDRLALVDETGRLIGEEYTLVLVADYVLGNYNSCLTQKVSVSNMSSTRALKDITEKRGGSYYSTPVGEVNVVAEMKKQRAAIGGEGNGGVIYPELHYGRDALVGVALILSFLAQEKIKLSELRRRYPDYVMIKHRLELSPDKSIDDLYQTLKTMYPEAELDDRDGLKLNLKDAWIHLRPSNTEPIARLYIEALDDSYSAQILAEILAKI